MSTTLWTLHSSSGDVAVQVIDVDDTHRELRAQVRPAEWLVVVRAERFGAGWLVTCPLTPGHLVPTTSAAAAGVCMLEELHTQFGGELERAA